MPLADIIDIVFSARPDAISLEAANPRHAHEYTVFETVKLPPGKVLIPGVIESKSNFIEHPELIAQRIGRYAKLVGRENVIAGSDCGYGTWVGQAAVDPDVVWAKTGGDGRRRAHRLQAVLELIGPMAAPPDPLHRDHRKNWPRTTARSSAREPARFDSILRPIRAFRLNYVPVVMVYFAYGALGLIDVTRDLWIKESLSFTPSQLAGIARLADAALDREDGVRRTGGHRADLRLAAQSLHPDRRRC